MDYVVRQLLREGYGVEDIAVMLEKDLYEIRLQVSECRRSGEIDDIIWRKGKSK